MKLRYKVLILVTALCMAGIRLYGQTIESLNREIARAEEEIRLAEALQGKIREDLDVSRSRLKLTRTKIANRRNIIASLDKQIIILDKDINSKRKSIDALGRRLSDLKRNYADMVRDTYKNYRLNNSLVFLFSARDFSDMTRRLDYMRRWNRMREREGGRIDSVSRGLNVQVDSLGMQLGRLSDKKKARGRELESLAAEQREYDSSLRRLTEQEKQIAGRIREKEKEKKKAEERLQKLIAEEARRAGEERRTASEEKYFTELTGRFDQNKGRLPLPVRSGVIIDRYGRHQHPTQKNLTIDNKGVNIAAEKGAAVCSVFDGTVTSIVFIKGLNNCVMVRHGTYLTVYSNLADVSVASGDRVGAYQTLGHLPAGADDDCFLHFELWENTSNLNPEPWFRK